PALRCNDPAEAIERPMTHRTSNSSAEVIFIYPGPALRAGLVRSSLETPILRSWPRTPRRSWHCTVGVKSAPPLINMLRAVRLLLCPADACLRRDGRVAGHKSFELDSPRCAKDTARRRGAPGRALCLNS